MNGDLRSHSGTQMLGMLLVLYSAGNGRRIGHRRTGGGGLGSWQQCEQECEQEGEQGHEQRFVGEQEKQDLMRSRSRILRPLP